MPTNDRQTLVYVSYAGPGETPVTECVTISSILEKLERLCDHRITAEALLGDGTKVGRVFETGEGKWVWQVQKDIL